MEIELTFTEPLLGTLAGDPEVATEFILSKHPEGAQTDELGTLEDAKEKASTLFSRNSDGCPILWDYQIKGFFKQACLAMIMSEFYTKEQLKKFRLTEYMYKRTIDLMVFVTPRRLVLDLPKGCDPNHLDFIERPLRGQTMRGERISLARSEVCPAGTRIKLVVETENPKLKQFVEQWLDYGTKSGIGQWRNSGMGRFEWKDLTIEEEAA